MSSGDSSQDAAENILLKEEKNNFVPAGKTDGSGNKGAIKNEKVNEAITSTTIADHSDSSQSLPQSPAAIAYESKTAPIPVKVAEKKPSASQTSSSKVKEEDDPCAPKKTTKTTRLRTPGLDPRFQQQNQTLRCYVMYTDFYRCEKILGEGHEACGWFKEVFNAICPVDWINRWDEYRTEGRLSWHKYKKQGDFPGDRYGV